MVDALFTERLIAVAAPDAVFPDDPGAIPDTDLIHTDWGRDYGVQPDWARYFDELGQRRVPDAGFGLRVDSAGTEAAAADVAALQLRRLGAAGNALPRDYVRVSTNARARRKGVQALRAQLRVYRPSRICSG